MVARTASCSCGALSIVLERDPIKVSVCHCSACQKRTGSAFSVAVFFDVAHAAPAGLSHRYTRPGDSGQTIEFHFCPACASTLYWYPASRPHWVGVAIGCLDDKTLQPTQVVYEHDRRDWVTIAINPAGA